jgi:hypothetical protein
MLKSIPPRLRTPVRVAVGSAVVVIVGGAVYGWGALLYLLPGVIVISVGYYLWSGRDSDMGAVLREQADERQRYRVLKIQALVGRVTAVAGAVAYLAAVAARATLWPFAIFLAVPFVALVAGWIIYRDRGGAAPAS